MSPRFMEHFSELKDPRIERGKSHELMNILVLAVCATISRAEGWEAIAAGESKLAWRRRFVPLKNGIPSHDCIAYVICRLSPKGFQECFARWVEGVREATEEKSNEITAIPKLLALLELRGCIITIDAMGCQREIPAQVVDQEADYVLGLKENQGSLYEAVDDYFTTAQAAGFKAVKHSYEEEIDKGHGRLEIRRYWITDDLSTLPRTDLWKGLRSIGWVERECVIGEKRCVERRYFINSIPADAKVFAHAVRGRWGIENRLHWRMDVILREDASRIRKGNAPAIMTTIRHLCLNLFQKEPSKLSLNMKRLRAAWDDDFRCKVLLA